MTRKSQTRFFEKAEGRELFRLFTFLLLSWGAMGAAGCSLTATRPVQEMSDTTAAIRAAREVQAQTLAPELYRQSNEWFLRARREYRLKNFREAKEYADRARLFAEQAEFEAVRNGAARESLNVPPPPPPPPPGGAPEAPDPASANGKWAPLPEQGTPADTSPPPGSPDGEGAPAEAPPPPDSGGGGYY